MQQNFLISIGFCRNFEINLYVVTITVFTKI